MAFMISCIANPEASGSSGSRVLASPAPAPIEQRPKSEKKILKFCKTKPSEARMSFRINSTFRNQAKNEPK